MGRGCACPRAAGAQLQKAAVCASGSGCGCGCCGGYVACLPHAQAAARPSTRWERALREALGWLRLSPWLATWSRMQ